MPASRASASWKRSRLVRKRTTSHRVAMRPTRLSEASSTHADSRRRSGSMNDVSPNSLSPLRRRAAANSGSASSGRPSSPNASATPSARERTESCSNKRSLSSRHDRRAQDRDPVKGRPPVHPGLAVTHLNHYAASLTAASVRGVNIRSQIRRRGHSSHIDRMRNIPCRLPCLAAGAGCEEPSPWPAQRWHCRERTPIPRR